MWFPFLLIASASYLERRRCAFVGVSADVGKRHAPCWEGRLSLRRQQTERGGRCLTIAAESPQRSGSLPGWLVNSELLPLFGAAFSPPGREKCVSPQSKSYVPRDCLQTGTRCSFLRADFASRRSAAGLKSAVVRIREGNACPSVRTLSAAILLHSTRPLVRSTAHGRRNRVRLTALRVRHEKRGTPRFRRL